MRPSPTLEFFVFSRDEIDNFLEVVEGTLKDTVETGNRVLPLGLSLSTVLPSQEKGKSVGQAVYGRPIESLEDIDRMSEIIRLLAMKGRAQAAAMAVVTNTSMLPAPHMFGDEPMDVAVVYLDHLREAYEVWYAPVLQLEDGITLGEFVQPPSMQGKGELPSLLPMALYGPAIGTA